LQGVPAVVSRSGYPPAEDGYEISTPGRRDPTALHGCCWKMSMLRPIGLARGIAALDKAVARLYGNGNIDEDPPQRCEASLKWAIQKVRRNRAAARRAASPALGDPMISSEERRERVFSRGWAAACWQGRFAAGAALFEHDTGGGGQVGNQ